MVYLLEFTAAMKLKIAKCVLLSLLSPVFVGCVLGLYFTVTNAGAGINVFISMVAIAISNAYIVGLSMAVFVVPGYWFLHKNSKVRFDMILMLGMLGGAVFSYVFSAKEGGALLINTVMATLAAGLFLYGLRRFA